MTADFLGHVSGNSRSGHIADCQPPKVMEQDRNFSDDAYFTPRNPEVQHSITVRHVNKKSWDCLPKGIHKIKNLGSHYNFAALTAFGFARPKADR
jgi:hypothetical protein